MSSQRSLIQKTTQRNNLIKPLPPTPTLDDVSLYEWQNCLSMWESKNTVCNSVFLSGCLWQKLVLSFLISKCKIKSWWYTLSTFIAQNSAVSLQKSYYLLNSTQSLLGVYSSYSPFFRWDILRIRAIKWLTHLLAQDHIYDKWRAEIQT